MVEIFSGGECLMDYISVNIPKETYKVLYKIVCLLANKNVNVLLDCLDSCLEVSSDKEVRSKSNIESVIENNIDSYIVSSVSNVSSVKEVKIEEKEKEKEERKEEIPSKDDVLSYVKEKGYHINAERFFNYYQQRNWYNGMDWKTKADEWEEKDKPKYTPAPKASDLKTNPYTGADDRKKMLEVMRNGNQIENPR